MGRLSQTVERIAHAWNAFNDSEQSQNPLSTLGGFGGSSSFGTRPDRVRTRFSNERSIITSIYTKVSVDFSGVLIRHVSAKRDQDRDLGVTLDRSIGHAIHGNPSRRFARLGRPLPSPLVPVELEAADIDPVGEHEAEVNRERDGSQAEHGKPRYQLA